MGKRWSPERMYYSVGGVQSGIKVRGSIVALHLVTYIMQIRCFRNSGVLISVLKIVLLSGSLQSPSITYDSFLLLLISLLIVLICFC